MEIREKIYCLAAQSQENIDKILVCSKEQYKEVMPQGEKVFFQGQAPQAFFSCSFKGQSQIRRQISFQARNNF